MSPDTKTVLMMLAVLLVPFAILAIAFCVGGTRRAIRLPIIVLLLILAAIMKFVFIRELIELQPDQFIFRDNTNGWHGGAVMMALMYMVLTLGPGALSFLIAVENDPGKDTG